MYFVVKVAETPQTTDGFIGDLFNMMLAPIHLLEAVQGNLVEEDEYIRAQSAGHYGKDCTEYNRRCPSSFFQVYAL